MVCVGGMEGIEREVELFRNLRSRAPIYVLGETGGASAILAKQRNDVHVIDRKVLDALQRREDETHLFVRENPTVPYPLIAQVMIDELTQGSYYRNENGLLTSTVWVPGRT